MTLEVKQMGKPYMTGLSRRNFMSTAARILPIKSHPFSDTTPKLFEFIITHFASHFP